MGKLIWSQWRPEFKKTKEITVVELSYFICWGRNKKIHYLVILSHEPNKFRLQSEVQLLGFPSATIKLQFCYSKLQHQKRVLSWTRFQLSLYHTNGSWLRKRLFIPAMIHHRSWLFNLSVLNNFWRSNLIARWKEWNVSH